ncbi:CST complex subunit [Vigna angularis]|uniref:CST complex subunit CTC1 n=1 Tax=Phaseolus angularis TaxID=3914 RepID=A0A8T0KBC5_PHAAN|nr:CST complex subunit [Vigna angularis]
MDDANATVTTLAELLQSPRPLTATAHSVFSSTPPPHRSTTCCVLTALPRSTVLVGTLTLPALSAPCSCLRFSDASATLCCDLLRFRPAALNREIRVTAWNFIPFKRHGCDVAHGLLEIINWRFSGTNQGSNAGDSLPLAPNCVRQSGARMRSLHGVVESVGPLFVVQCTMAASTSGLNSGSKVNLPGFSVQLMCCECRFCCSKEVLIGKLNESRKGHSFTKMEIVYFCGSASSWHPAITKLIDKRIVVSGLKKKLVYLTKEESREMYVTKDESALHVGSCSEKCMPSLKSEIKGKGECGSYIGVVKGAYMQGMVLELDHDVWLLLTDQLHTSMHGLRVGSIFSILSREARYNGRSLRRIIQSEDVGVVLLGYLKVDPSTRRLHLVDATGGVDIVIPDLPLTWNPNEIYEVTEYEVFMDKIDEPVDQIERLGSENIPLYSCINSKNESETLEPGSYHMLRVSHKFPLQEKYSNKAGCIKSSTFVEAMLFPFILLFDWKSGIARPCNASWDKTKELSKSCLSGNNEYKFSNKRQKLVKESVSSSKEEFHTSIYELSACSNSSRKPEENRKCVNMRSSHDLSCLVTFKCLQSENEVCPAILRSALPMKDASLNSKPSSRKILLEFSSDRFLKYQIGDYYIIDNKRRDISGSTKDVDFEYTSAKDSLSPSADGVSSNHQKLLPRSNSEPSSVSSDVCLYLPISLADVFEDNVLGLQRIDLNLVLELRSNSLFPEGNLMSLEGNVIEIHKTGSGFFSSCSSGANVDSLQLKGLVGTRSNFCIHVLVHHHIVNICGSVNKHTFPIGFGPGVTAVFHRILYASMIDSLSSALPSVLSSTKDADDASREYISCLISELPQGLTHKKIVHRCRVVAVLVLVIERKTTNFIAETKVNAQGTLLDIPLAFASGNALCSSDENILKFILCNACIGGIWNVVAGGMDAEETRQLGEEYLTEMLNVHNMRNMWAEEVSYPRTRAEARHMIQELLKN